MNRSQFIDTMLLDGRIPLEHWGRDADRKIDELYRDYESGKRRLLKCPDGKLLIKTISVVVRVEYFKKVLVETAREDARGRPVTVRSSSAWTLSEIVPQDEAPEHVAMHALAQILCPPSKKTVASQFDLKSATILMDRPRLHSDYPGIWVRGTVYCYVWDMPSTFYSPLGYTQKTSEARISYEWMHIFDQKMIAEEVMTGGRRV